MAVTRLPYAEARALQKTHYREHGTTLHGLMLHHGVDPDHFLKTVHDIDYSGVPAHPGLARRAMAALPGRKFILTNGDVGHAEAVLNKGWARRRQHRHLRYPLDAVQTRRCWLPIRVSLEAHGVDATRTASSTTSRRTMVPHEIGMRTVLVTADDDFEHAQVESWELGRGSGPHIHHTTDVSAGFLGGGGLKHGLAGAGGAGAVCRGSLRRRCASTRCRRPKLFKATDYVTVLDFGRLSDDQAGWRRVARQRDRSQSLNDAALQRRRCRDRDVSG